VSVALPGWHLHLDTWLLVVALAGAWAWSLRREQRRRGPGGEPVVTRAQRWSFLAGVVVLWAASDWPIHDLAEDYLYSVHMVQHLLMTLVAGLLLVAGTPGWLVARLLAPRWLRRPVRGLSRPVLNLVQFNLVLVVSHWPLVVDATLVHHPLHFVAHAVLVASAVLMWLPVASQSPLLPRLAPPSQMVYLFLQTILPTVPASFLTFGTTPLYPRYATFPRLWDLSVITDQQIAGLVMKIGGGLFLWVVIAVVFFRWYEREEGGGRPRARGQATPPAPLALTRAGPGEDGPGDPELTWEAVERELARLEGERRTPG